MFTRNSIGYLFSLKGKCELRVIFPLLFFFNGQALSDEIEMKVTVSRWAPTSLAFSGKLIRWEVDSARSNPLNTAECLALAGSDHTCTLGFGIYLQNSSVGGEFKTFPAEPWMRNSKTMADLARAANMNGFIGRSVTFKSFYTNPKGVKQCMYLGYMPYTGGGLRSFPNSLECNYAELTNVCKISEDSLYIRHGTISSNQVNGHSASTVLHVSCDTDMRVRIRPERPQDYIVLNPGNDLRSYISVNGNAMGTDGVVVNATTGMGAAVNITSTLANYRGQEGMFSGSMVLVVAIE